MKRSYLWILSGLVLAVGAGAEPEQQTVSPGQIVKEVLAHSRQLKIAGNDVRALEARAAQASAARRPSLRLQAGATQYSGLEEALLGPQILIPKIEDRYHWSADVTQLVYAGGRVDASGRAARFEAAAADLSGTALESDLRFQALTAYWTWAKSLGALNSVKAAMVRMDAHAADIRNLKQSGAATENDVASAETLLAQTKLKFEDARRNLDLARARLAYLAGRELPADALPQKPGTPDVAKPMPGGDLVGVALGNRQERRSARLAAEAFALQVKAAKASYQPQLSLVARYEQARPNSLFFPPADEWNSDAFVGVSVSWSLYEGGLDVARVREAAARADSARERAESWDEVITLEVREAVIRHESALSRCGVARQAEDSAKRNLESAATLWKNGMARHSELLDAESRFSDAQYETAVSEADAALAAAALRHAVGSLND